MHVTRTTLLVLFGTIVVLFSQVPQVGASEARLQSMSLVSEGLYEVPLIVPGADGQYRALFSAPESIWVLDDSEYLFVNPAYLVRHHDKIQINSGQLAVSAISGDGDQQAGGASWSISDFSAFGSFHLGGPVYGVLALNRATAAGYAAQRLFSAMSGGGLGATVAPGLQNLQGGLGEPLRERFYAGLAGDFGPLALGLGVSFGYEADAATQEQELLDDPEDAEVSRSIAETDSSASVLGFTLGGLLAPMGQWEELSFEAGIDLVSDRLKVKTGSPDVQLEDGLPTLTTGETTGEPSWRIGALARVRLAPKHLFSTRISYRHMNRSASMETSVDSNASGEYRDLITEGDGLATPLDFYSTEQFDRVSDAVTIGFAERYDPVQAARLFVFAQVHLAQTEEKETGALMAISLDDDTALTTQGKDQIELEHGMWEIEAGLGGEWDLLDWLSVRLGARYGMVRPQSAEQRGYVLAGNLGQAQSDEEREKPLEYTKVTLDGDISESLDANFGIGLGWEGFTIDWALSWDVLGEGTALFGGGDPEFATGLSLGYAFGTSNEDQ